MNLFQQLAYEEFFEMLPEGLEPEVAERLETFEGLLSTLDTLELIKGRHCERAMAYKAKYGWVKPAWEDIVNRMGLSTDDYAAVREFKAKSISPIFLKEYERPEQTLLVLEGSTVPVGLLQEYRQPLVNLLNTLIRLRSAGQH